MQTQQILTLPSSSSISKKSPSKSFRITPPIQTFSSSGIQTFVSWNVLKYVVKMPNVTDKTIFNKVYFVIWLRKEILEMEKV